MPAVAISSTLLSVALVASVSLADEVRISVDGANLHQVWEGFGATTLSLVPADAKEDPLSPELRHELLDAVYHRAGLTMGNLALGWREKPALQQQGETGHDDAGVDTLPTDSMWKYVVHPAAALGLDNYSLQGNINWRWTSPELAKLYHTDRARCLEKCADQVEHCVRYWHHLAGGLPRYVHLFNEPTSGNCEIQGADATMVRDIVKTVGARLHHAGFTNLKFVVPNEETVSRSIEVARVILEDPEARAYVAAVGYHVYPYGSPYASVPRILHTSGQGQPDEQSIHERHGLRELCAHYGIPAWMTEVSHGEVDPRSFEHLLGRAIHIHDEMVYADAAAYYGMNAMWDRRTHESHFAGRGGESPSAYLSEQDTIALADNSTGQVLITGMGYAIGHYARFVKRGAVRLDANSSDALVQVTAFRDEHHGRLVLVLINCSSEPRQLRVALNHLAVAGPVTGTQSTELAKWQAWKAEEPQDKATLQLSLPPRSVTSCDVALAAQHASMPDTSESHHSDSAAQREPIHGHAQSPQSAKTDAGGSEVVIISAPAQAIAPDVVIDAHGLLHMVYGQQKNAYYVRSSDNGRTFTPPLKLNNELGVTTTMGERGPKLALGAEGVIHAVWQDLWSPGAHVFPRYTRSLDGGRSFEQPRAVSETWGIDGTALTADALGKVMVFWHVMDQRKPPVPQATWLYATRSTDHGATFGTSEALKIDALTGLACSMCQMRARVDSGGNFCLAFRAADDNIRDFYVLKGSGKDNAFRAIRVNRDEWKIDFCPMCGPELNLSADGRLLSAFMSRNRVYWAISDPQVSRFDLHVATPAEEKDEIYPMAVANRKGDVLFVWQVGPMSTTGRATVKWARYSMGGQFTGRQGTLGQTTSGTKAAAFVGADDRFYIVTTAEPK
jgi:O-glycosyl hydrolase